MDDKDRIAALKELEAARWESHQREHEQLEKAINIARDGMNYRLEGMNEFRKQLEANEQKYFPRGEWQAYQSVITKYQEGVDARFRQLERLIWIAMGGIGVVSFLMHWLQR